MQDRPILKLKSVATNSSQELNSTNRPKLTLKINDSDQLTPVTDKPAANKIATDKADKIEQNLDQAAISEQETLINKDNTNSTKANKQKKKPKYYLQPDIYKEILGFLQTTYPLCFTNPPVALAVGIHNDLRQLQPQFSKTIIRKFMHNYCRKTIYRKSLVVGAARINLIGKISSYVIEEEVSTANKNKSTNDPTSSEETAANLAEK